MKKSLNKKGFSLVELIVVIAIMAVLISVSAPTIVGYINKSKGAKAIYKADEACTSSNLALHEWKMAGSPGNGDASYKINIETRIISLLGFGDMNSFTDTTSPENSVQVALSLPSYYSQGWEKFINECKTNNYRNFVRVWIGKDPGNTVGETIKGIYYVSSDGKFAARVIYDETTKLGTEDQRTGSYYEIIK